METQALLRNVRVTPRKARLIADQIRGKSVEKALEILSFSIKQNAKYIKKVLNSAIANAEHNEGADVDELYVSAIYVEQGRSLKRVMPRARGRANRILKRVCHIIVKVAINRGNR